MQYLRAFLYAFIPAIPLLGLPLLGWGFDDLRGFFSVHPRLGYGFLLGALTLANIYQAIEVPEVSNSRKGEAGKRVRRQSAVVVGVLLLLFLTLFFLPFADRRGIGVIMAGQAVRWLGLVLCAFGTALGFWSRITLGRMYSSEVTIQESHQLIKTGPYRHIRHPVYLGVICFFSRPVVAVPLVDWSGGAGSDSDWSPVSDH